MVKYDATYSILHAGNYELLLLRNRRDQTVYISDVIEPHIVGKGMPGNPGYYQIHIGLCISAIRDAIARARQLKEFGGAEDILPDTWTRPYDRGGTYKPVSWLFSSYIVRFITCCLGSNPKALVSPCNVYVYGTLSGARKKRIKKLSLHRSKTISPQYCT
jgi:hypothetical protein